MKIVGLVAAYLVGVAAFLVALLMVGFLVWDLATGRWTNLMLDLFFGVLAVFVVRGCLRFRRRLTTI